MKVKGIIAVALALAAAAVMTVGFAACGDDLPEGFKEYVMEAEYVAGIENVQGAGMSSNQSGYDLIYGDGTDAQKELGWSEGYYVGYTYSPNFSMDFKFTADKAGTATIVLRLGSEIGDITLTPDEFEITLNGTSLQYGSIFVECGAANDMSKMTFSDKTITSSGQLKAGENTLNISVHANELRGGQTGGPAIDYVKITTDAKLDYKQNTDNPSKRGGI